MKAINYSEHKYSITLSYYCFSTASKEHVAFGPLPTTFAVHSQSYLESVNSLVAACNLVYNQYLTSYEGHGFRGKV